MTVAMSPAVEPGPGADDEHRKREQLTVSAPASPQIPAKRKIDSSSAADKQQHAQSRRPSNVGRTISYEKSITSRKFQPDVSIVLVGIRGTGKRSLGFIAATALGRRFITEDYFFQTVTGLSRQGYLRTHGSEQFHRIDIEVTRKMLDENRYGCIIDCGLGSLTGGVQEYLKSYSLTNPVIYILRDMEPIKELLKLGERSARLLETGDPSHRRCSNYEFYNLEDGDASDKLESDGPDRASPAYSFKLRELQADFSHFVERVAGWSSDRRCVGSPFSLEVPVERRLFTHAMEIALSFYEDKKVRIRDLQSGGDVVEIHVDRWQSGSMRCLSRMVAEVRRELRVPILISANRQRLPESYITILRHCLRLAVEWLSVDLYLEPRYIAEFIALKGPTRLMGSCILRPSEGKSVWVDGLAMAAYDLATKLRIDVVRLMYVAKSRKDNDDVKHFNYVLKKQAASGPPCIAYNLGPLGRTSQVLNATLTTVTHKVLQPFTQSSITAQKPTVTAQDAIKALFASYILDPLKFCIIGGNVTESLSPAMHNAAYQRLGLSHTYVTQNIRSCDDVDELAKDQSFGGASVVQPWKVRLVSKVAHLSQHARIIGAINTLLPLRADSSGNVLSLELQARQRNRTGRIVAWFGDNTDWIAMSECIGRSLSPRNVVQPKTTALVIGAGGMARSAIYALVQMGCRNVFIYNRTQKNAEALAAHYNEWLSSRDAGKGSSPSQVTVLESTDLPWPSDHIMPTIVVSCVSHENLDGDLGSNFTMPSQWLQSESGGVVVELAYMTRETPLTQQIKQYRAESGVPWVVVDGLDALFEQALTQFELMTGRKAPKLCMFEAISQAIQQKQTFAADGAEYSMVQ